MSKKLTDSIQLRHGAELKSRIVMPPMLTLSGLEGGFASEETLRYYAARSQAAALLIAEFHYVSENGGPCSPVGLPEQLAAYSDAHLDSLRGIAQALKKDGNKAILQLHHGGREAKGRAAKGLAVFAPSAIDYPFLNYPVKELSDTQIWEIIEDFGRATKRAIDAGFDGVEIHGANHYGLQQFFSAYSNRRHDDWGGTLTKRMHFALEIVKKVKAVIAQEASQNFILGYRLCPDEIHGDTIGYTHLEAQALVSEILRHELDYIHLSLWGSYRAKPPQGERSYTQLFKDILSPQTQLIVVGSVFSEKEAMQALEEGADLIGVGRGTLIDPMFGQKILEKRGDEIISEISPEQLQKVAWPEGLKKRYCDPKNTLPSLPNNASIYPLHSDIVPKA